MIRMSLAISAALLATAATAATPDTPRPGKLKLFRDWIVACDNGRDCETASLAAEDSALQDVGLIVARDGAGRVTVRIRDMTGKAKTASVRVDGRTIASTPLDRDGEGAWQGAPAQALVSALARGKRAALLTPAAHPVALAGAAAAFRYMDDRQGRAGTTTALVARGGKRYRGGAPALPVVQIVTPPPVPPRHSRHRDQRGKAALWLRDRRWQPVQRRCAPARPTQRAGADVVRRGSL